MRHPTVTPPTTLKDELTNMEAQLRLVIILMLAIHLSGFRTELQTFAGC